MDLTNVLRLSHAYGKNPAFVLGEGGNTSVKDETILYVKRSGVALAAMEAGDFVPVSRKKLEATATKAYPEDDEASEAAYLADAAEARVISDDPRQPSVEALAHALFPQTYMLHLHPALVNGLTCGKEGARFMETLFGEAALWVPPARPGYMLGKLCRGLMEDYKRRMGEDVRLMFLQNHGIFAAADTIEEIDQMFGRVLHILEEAVGERPLPPDGAADPGEVEAIARMTGAKAVRFQSSPQILEITASRARAAAVMAPLTPGHVAGCGLRYPYLNQVADMEGEVLEGRIVLLKDRGFFALGQTEAGAEKAEISFLDMINTAVYAKSFGGPQGMPEAMAHFIYHWDVEAYRQKEGIR